MINVGYVNDSINMEFDNIFDHYDMFLESSGKEIDSMFFEFDILREKITLESAIMGSVSDHMITVYESSKGNIFTKIGETIIKLYENIKKTIDMVIDKLRELSLKKKSDLQKLELLLKKHPELKDEAIGAFREGVLDLSDIKSLKELDDAFNEIIKMTREKADPKSIKTKWEKAKSKFEKDGVITSAAKKTSIIIGAAAAVAMFIPNCAKAIDELKKAKASRDENMAKALNIVEKLKNEPNAEIKVDRDVTNLQTLLQAQRYMDRKFTDLSRATSSAWANMVFGIAGFINKLNKDAGKKTKENLETTKKISDRADAEKKESDKLDAFEKGRMQQAGRDYAKNTH